MSAVLNDRDAILQAASVRIVNPKNAWIDLVASAPGFHVNAAGQADLNVVTITANLTGLDSIIAFTAVGGSLSNAKDRSVDVTYAGQAAIVTATVVSGGDEFKRSFVIPVLRDGSSGAGTPGARGAGHYYGSGSAWTDTLANITVPTTKVVGDVVTISSGTYVMEKRWTGSAWVETGTVLDGKLIVSGSILTASLAAGAVTADKVDARGLSIKDSTGNIILNAGLTLAEQAASNPNLAPNCRGFSMKGGASSERNGDVRFGDGQYLWLGLATAGTYVAGESPPLRIPPGAPFTVSFDAYATVEGNTRTLYADVYNDIDVDSGGIAIVPTTTMKRYKVTEIMPPTGNAPATRLRIYADGAANLAGAGNIVVSNIKVELGSKMTPWNDSVITAENASTFIMAAAIKLAMIDKASIGNLQALTAYLGNVEIGPGGSLRQGMTDFLVGKGFFLGERNGKPCLAIGDPQGTGACFYWDGAALVQQGVKSVTGFRVTLSSYLIGQQTQTSTYRDYGNLVPEFSGGPAPYRLSWALNADTGLLLTVSPDGMSVNVRAKGLNGQLVTGSVSLTAYDGNNAIATTYSPIEIGFGSNPVPT